VLVVVVVEVEVEVLVMVTSENRRTVPGILCSKDLDPFLLLDEYRDDNGNDDDTFDEAVPLPVNHLATTVDEDDAVVPKQW